MLAEWLGSDAWAKLQLLDLSSNPGLAGSLAEWNASSQPAPLQALKSLDLSSCNVSGLPSAFGSSLKSVSLANNPGLAGKPAGKAVHASHHGADTLTCSAGQQLPAAWANSSLQVLNVSNTSMQVSNALAIERPSQEPHTLACSQGVLPPAWGQGWASLTHLDISHCPQLGGAGECLAFAALHHLKHGSHAGSIPPLGPSGMQSLQILAVQGCNFSGPFPDVFATCVLMQCCSPPPLITVKHQSCCGLA